MRFLWPAGGEVSDDFAGILTTPATYGIPLGIAAGRPWAAENQAFTKGFRPDVFFPWFEFMQPYRETCLFVAVPDKVGDAAETLRLFHEWFPHFNGWPLAFVAQDGQESLDFPAPELWDTLFVGGSTRWKLSAGADTCIARAQELGKHIHIGRVNYKRRYQHFAGLPGSEEFTCDGTRQRFEGGQRTMAAWVGYMAAPKQIRFTLSGGDSDG